MVREIEAAFPKLQPSNYCVTSPKDKRYNCIAWALGDTRNWWEPDELELGYWPAGIPRDYSMSTLIRALQSLGYEACEHESPEPGCEKVAIFADAMQAPTHMARQLAEGRWTSKLGKLEDIEHDLLDLTDSIYGSVVQFMKRRIAQQA